MSGRRAARKKIMIFSFSCHLRSGRIEWFEDLNCLKGLGYYIPTRKRDWELYPRMTFQSRCSGILGWLTIEHMKNSGSGHIIINDMQLGDNGRTVVRGMQAK